MKPTATWILIPGLGTDHRYFANIVDLLPDHQIIRFEIPQRGESIEEYAERLRAQIKTTSPIVLGGVSFGGMLASIMCRHVQPTALVLMSSATTPDFVHTSVRVFEWMSRVWPDTFTQWARQLGSRPLHWLEPMPPEQVEYFKELVRDGDLRLIHGGGRMIMQWREPPPIACPVFHIHGSRDLLIPAAAVQPTHIVEGAGHLMNLTHSEPVRNFIREVQTKLSESAGSEPIGP